MILRTLGLIRFELLGINRCQAFNGIQPGDNEVATIIGLINNIAFLRFEVNFEALKPLWICQTAFSTRSPTMKF